MTMPDERFRAVQRTRKFLTDTLWCKYDEIEEGSPAWNEARRCLKHFPSDYHMEDVAEVSEHFESPTGIKKTLDISRFEYITEDGREVVSYAKHTFQLQDDMRTLKVFREKE